MPKVKHLGGQEWEGLEKGRGGHTWRQLEHHPRDTARRQEAGGGSPAPTTRGVAVGETAQRQPQLQGGKMDLRGPALQPSKHRAGLACPKGVGRRDISGGGLQGMGGA